jgi:mannose-6-phosphate isomerase-like protein (cupin superfamily)
MKLRNILFAAVLVLPTTSAFAQGAMPDLKTFASSAEVQALLDKAKAMPPKPTISQNIVFVAPYRVNLEYRRNLPNLEVSSHPKEHLLIYVIDGAGTHIMGGTITNGAITGGTSTHVTKGDFIFLPANTPHEMVPDSGGVAVVTIHVPVESLAAAQ